MCAGKAKATCLETYTLFLKHHHHLLFAAQTGSFPAVPAVVLRRAPPPHAEIEAAYELPMRGESRLQSKFSPSFEQCESRKTPPLRRASQSAEDGTEGRVCRSCGGLEETQGLDRAGAADSRGLQQGAPPTLRKQRVRGVDARQRLLGLPE